MAQVTCICMAQTIVTLPWSKVEKVTACSGSAVAIRERDMTLLELQNV
jgi:hypothetical protein